MSDVTDTLIAEGFRAINQSMEQMQARYETHETRILESIARIGKELAEEKKSASAWPDFYVNVCSD